MTLELFMKIPKLFQADLDIFNLNIPSLYSFLSIILHFFVGMRIKGIVIFLSFFYLIAGAQEGGSGVYSFLEIPASARIAAMGGTFITVKDNDLNTALQAPSLLNSSMNNSLSLSGVSYVDGVKFGDAGYVRDFGKFGTYMASMHYAAYGQFLETDEFGNINGTFHASDYALTISGGYQFNPKFSFGAAFKTIYSDYYIYNAFGAAIDLSATFADTLNHFTATFVFRNAGVQFKNYIQDNNESLPAEALIGISKRLIHTPLRFSLTYRHLEKFDLSYSDPYNLGDVDPVTGEPGIKSINFFNKLSRHFIIGTEILLSKNFNLRVAYNFQRRREMTIDTRPGLVGFSMGVGLKVSKFIISYGRGNFHIAGGANHFSITTNLSEFNRKEK